jgi:opacity protein-like surface antigen
MNIKSLLIGSAALATVSTGAQAADAIVMADPEPMEYVRICDVYGAGFFYIPGTETCLAIGGYMRYQVNINAAGFTKLARFAPRFDVRSDTEIGTIRGFAEVEIDWQRAANRLKPGHGCYRPRIWH